MGVEINYFPLRVCRRLLGRGGYFLDQRLKNDFEHSRLFEYKKMYNLDTNTGGDLFLPFFHVKRHVRVSLYMGGN